VVYHERIRHLICAAVVVALFGYCTTAYCAGAAASMYEQRCVSCHGVTGKGDGPAGKYLSPKPTDFAVSLKGKSDKWIAKAIKGGGLAVGEAAVMPAYGDLSDQQIKELVSYIKKLGS
jgi:mono/diheme cytochrome c family protein